LKTQLEINPICVLKTRRDIRYGGSLSGLVKGLGLKQLRWRVVEY